MSSREVETAAAKTLFKQGYSRFEEGEYEAAVAVADALLDQFDKHGSLGRADIVVSALRLKAEAIAREGRSREAIMVLDDLDSRFGTVDEPAVGRNIARALVKAANLLDESGDHEGALRTYDKLVARFRAALQPEVRRSVALGLQGTLYELQVLRRCQDSLTVADELLEYLSDGAVPGHPDTVLEALGGKLWALEELGETRNAIAVATEIVSLYGNEPEPTRRVREKVAWALAAKARLLVVAGAHSEVPPIVDDLVRRYGESRDPDVRVQVARALRSKASALAKLGQWDAVNKALDERTLEYAGITAEPGLGELAVEILGLRALALRRLGKLELAAALWGEKAEHYGVESSPRMRQLVAHALTQKAELLAATGENVQAIVVSDAVIECLSDLADRQEQIRLADALGAKGMALIGEARCEEAVGILDELIERFQDSLESALRRQVTIALANKVTALEHLDRVAAAASVFEDMITRFGAEALVMFEGTVAQFISGSEPEEREGLASALYGRGVSLDKLGRRDEALQTLDGLITRFETDENSAIKDIVSEARDARERTLDGDDDLTRPRTARRTRLAFSKSLQGSGLVDRVAR